jgi:hypothetical protein
MPFTDDEILLLLELDLDLDDVAPGGRTRLWNALWWAAVTVGSLAGMYVVLQADYGYHAAFTG